jgi:hypothetical protein
VQDEVVRTAVGEIRAGVDALLKSGLTALSPIELTELFAELEAERRRLEAVDHQFVAQVRERHLCGEYAAGSVPDLLIDLLRLSPAEAKRRTVSARDLGPRHGMSGEPLEPIFPEVAAAQAAGEISSEHARTVMRIVDAIPLALQAEHQATVEATLVEFARRMNPMTVAQLGQQIIAHLDPDGAKPRAEEEHRRRDFGAHKCTGGGATPYGHWTPEALAIWTPILDSLSAPQPESAEGERDDRTAGQRRHDAFVEAGRRLLRSGELPDSGGVPVTLIAHLGEDQLRERTGYATTGTGDQMSVAELLALAAEAEVVSVLFDPSGGISSYGRARRLASCGQRQALAARDRGCSFPGCTRPPSWCEAHHVIAWIDGGPTDLSNLCLVCSFHHREFERRGWQVVMNAGLPEWIPPPWLDPDRRPRRNTAHHLPEIDFSATV